VRKRAVQATVVSVCLLFGAGAAAAIASQGDVLVGVTWSDGTLVSFDPASGEILQSHVQIEPTGSFVALAWDRNHRRLHALSQGDHILYTLDTATLQLANVVPLRIPPEPGVADVTSLAYDPVTDTLYAVVGHWENYPVGPISEDLAKVDPWTGDLTLLGRIEGPWITGLAFSETERVLYGLAVDGAGAWDSPDTTRVIRIDPTTAASETVYVTPYHVMLGMALKDPGTFFSWVNGSSRFFGQTDVPALSLTPLGGDDSSGAIGAMLVKTFDLPPEPVLPGSSPVGFLYKGRVTEVSDPLNRLAGRVREGQLFRGQIAYDADVPFMRIVANQGSPYGITLQSGRFGLLAPGYAAALVNDRLDPADSGPTDEFRLRATTTSGVVFSWALVDAGGNAVAAGDRLPEDFDLSKWPASTFTVTAYDPCCLEPIYRFTGRVDEIQRRPGLAARPLPRSKRHGGN